MEKEIIDAGAENLMKDTMSFRQAAPVYIISRATFVRHMEKIWDSPERFSISFHRTWRKCTCCISENSC